MHRRELQSPDYYVKHFARKPPGGFPCLPTFRKCPYQVLVESCRPIEFSFNTPVVRNWQTDRLADRQTLADRQADRQTLAAGRQTLAVRQTDRQILADRQADRQTLAAGRQTLAVRQTDTGGQADRLADRQAGRQTLAVR